MIVIIDYGLGNLASISNAFYKLEIPVKISGSPLVIKKAKALILPGVGAAGQGMKNLKQRNLDKVIIEEVKKSKPILGICLGMQLFLSSSEEGNVNCLNLIKGKVKKLPISSSRRRHSLWRRTAEVSGEARTPRTVEEATTKKLTNLKIPQIGWNEVKIPARVSQRRPASGSGWSASGGKRQKAKVKNLFKNIPNKSYFYFVNSYYCQPKDKSAILTTTDYGIEFCSVLGKNNLLGVQFHPEKSGKLGLQLLKNWEALC